MATHHNNSLSRLCVTIAATVLAAVMACVSAKDFVVALDAGHGGKDLGAIGKTTNEKTIVLSVVKQLGKMIDENIDNVKVVYTRDTDEFLTLNERASVANNEHADLFISIHVNSVDKRNRNRTHIEGCQVYTLGLHKSAENLEVAKRENAVMELDANESERYAEFDPNSLESDIIFELSQNKHMEQSIEFAEAIHNQLVKTAGRAPKGVRQAGFWVLWATSMPSVLVELDFICNPNSEKYLASTKGQTQMVTALYNAFCAYLNAYGPQMTGHFYPLPDKISPIVHSAETVDADQQVADAYNASLFANTVSPEKQPDGENDENTGNDENVTSMTDCSNLLSNGEQTYHIQILAATKPIKSGSSELKGYKDVGYYKEGKLYKYFVGNLGTEQEARKRLNEVRKKFPKAFIIKMKDGSRIGQIF